MSRPIGNLPSWARGSVRTHAFANGQGLTPPGHLEQAQLLRRILGGGPGLGLPSGTGGSFDSLGVGWFAIAAPRRRSLLVNETEHALAVLVGGIGLAVQRLVALHKL